MTDNLMTVRALAARTRANREASVTRAVERVAGSEHVTEVLRATLSLDVFADSKAGGGTMTVRECADAYRLALGATQRAIMAGKIVATHDTLRDSVLSVMDAETVTPDMLETVAPVLALVKVIGRTHNDRPAPNASEVETVALNPSADPIGALEALITTRMDAATVTETGETGEDETGETETGETTDAEKVAALMETAIRNLQTIANTEGWSALITSDDINALGLVAQGITAARGKAARAARSKGTAAA